ncbi:MAG TPA: protein kinase, partial [Polyangiaceae bacterium]
MSGAALFPGSIFARDYRIVAPLGQGGMGTLYTVEQISTGKKRALKLMHPTLVGEAEHRDRFVREAQVGARIASEHVVEVTAAGFDDETRLPYIAMELLEGETLQSYVKRRACLPTSELLVVYQQLCHAMMAAHAAGII